MVLSLQLLIFSQQSSPPHQLTNAIVLAVWCSVIVLCVFLVLSFPLQDFKERALRISCGS